VANLFEKAYDLFIRDLLEVPVPESYRLKVGRREKADEVVRLRT
jgi:hypothetical protein